MDVLDDVLKSVQRAGKQAVKKAGEVKDLAKLNMEVRSKEDFIERQYAEIGRRVYETEKDSDSTAFEEVFLITRTYEEIEEIRKEIAQVKGMIKCEACGADIDPDVSYCPVCGVANANKE